MDQNITLQDLTVIVSIIDVCSERGAFKGNELMVVGQLREKVSAFVKQNQPVDEKQKDTESVEMTDEVAE